MDGFLLDNLFWVITAALSAAGLVWTFVVSGRVNLSPQAAVLAVSRGGGVFLDVRSAAEFAAGYIPRSQNIPNDELPQRMASIAKFKQKPVVVVCERGMRARKTAQQLAKEGYDQVHVLSGGIMGWREAHLPLLNLNKKKAK